MNGHSSSEMQDAVEIERKRLLDEFLMVRQLDYNDLKQRLVEKLPIDNPRELRAIALKMSIETLARVVDFRDISDNDVSDIILERAKKFEAYITGETK